MQALVVILYQSVVPVFYYEKLKINVALLIKYYLTINMVLLNY